MGPFAPAGFAATSLNTVGVAASTLAVTPGRQIVLMTPATNTDNVHFDFNSTAALAATTSIPVAGGAKGGMGLPPNSVVELTVPAGQNSMTAPIIGNFIGMISGTAAQKLFITEGADV